MPIPAARSAHPPFSKGGGGGFWMRPVNKLGALLSAPNWSNASKSSLLAITVAVFASLTLSLIPAAESTAGTTPPPQVNISTMPLNVVVPTHPEVMIALTNSMSMDSSDNIIDDANKNLTTGAPGSTTNRTPSSAIMTWSGRNSADNNMTPNAPNTTPTNYYVPAGFTPPVSGGAAGSSVPYTAPVNTYPITTSGGNYWSTAWWQCIQNVTVPIGSTDVSLPPPIPQYYPSNTAPANIPAPTSPVWPGTVTPWDPTQTWYYNGTTNGIGGTGYFGPGGTAPPPYPFPDATTSINKVPSARALFHGTASELALNGNGGLQAVGMGNGNVIHPITNASGGPVQPPPCGPNSPSGPCPAGPTTKQVCGLYQYNAPGFVQPWTQTNYYTQYADNSPSRLNIAKASIEGVIQAYGTQVNFGLMTYNVSGLNRNYYSWAYYMSGPNGFTPSDFSNSYSAPTYNNSTTPPTLVSQWVINPCWNGNNWGSNCSTIAATLAPQLGLSTTAAWTFVKSNQFLQVASRSDDPNVNDVLLGGWNSNFQFFTGGTITPSSPYPPNFTVGDYNCGQSCSSPNQSVNMIYSLTSPNWVGPYGYAMHPTNSGFVPAAPQVIYSYRGLPWNGTPASNSGNILVPVQAAAGISATQQQQYLQQFSVYLTPENDVAASDTVTVPGVSPAITYYNYYKNAIAASALQSPVAGMLSSAANSSVWPATTITGSVSGCIPPRYVILITDGLPTEALDGTLWPPPGSSAAAGYGVTVNFNGDGTVNMSSTNKAVTDAITTINNLRNAGIKTFVVGMGPGANPTLNPTAAKVLKAMAIAGGTRDYYPGTSASAVVAQLNAILNIINALNVASVSGAVNTTVLNTSTMVYQASFTGYDTPYQDWTGNVQAFPVNASTGIVSTTPTWSAQGLLDSQNWSTGRLIATCGSTPGGGCAPNSGIPFRWTSLSSAMQTALNTNGVTADALGSDRLAYLRGDTSNYGPGGDDFRPRSHILGDIVDSAALYVAASNGQYDGMTNYNAFLTTTQSRTPMIYVGANDGMLHAFNAANGQEAFAFIPNGVFGKLAQLSNPNYNNNHQFYVDGSPTAGDVQFADGSWHTVLAGGLNDGGNSIYALDITNPSAINSETALKNAVLWEFTDPYLGLTYSQPVFALTSDTSSTNANPNGFLLFFGSGYNNVDGNDYLYAVNPQTGALVKRINLCSAVSGACSSSLPNGLSGVTVVNSSGAVGQAATTVYAGDLQGNLWRIDITNSNPSNWGVKRLFRACYPLSGGGCTPQPITTTPVVTLNPAFPSVAGTVVYFGTGEYLGTPDISNVATQSFYGVLDNGSGTNLTRTGLVQQTLTATNTVINGNNVTLRTVSNNTVNWNTTSGWYMDLPIAGERVVTNPRLYNGEVVFTTYVPTSAALCQGGGQSFLMVLNYKNGSSFPLPQLDLNGDGKLNGADQISGQNPVGISLGNVYASAPTILASNIGADKAVKLITVSTPTGQSNGNFVNVGEAGGQAAKLSWTQIR